MGFKLWDLEAGKIVRSNDVFLNEEIKRVEICRVVFQEDGHVHNRQVAQVEQHGQNAPIAQEGREEQHVQEA